jgi:transcriptional regulator with XRE-family HTH domain
MIATAAPSKEITRQALDAPRLTLNDLAEVTGATRASLDKYRQGVVNAPLPVRLHLAQFLEAHAHQLQELAGALREGIPTPDPQEDHAGTEADT